jgi:hypothetical protein
MSKKKFHPLFSWIMINLGTLLIRILGMTWRYERLTPAAAEPAIYASWHRDILPLLFLHRNEGAIVLISQSSDGDLVAAASRKLGYLPVRGSSTRGGGKAIREMIKLSQNRYIGITPDGPLGPAGKIKEGLVFVAKATGLPIVPIAVSVSREIVFNTWDRFRLPLPFSRIRVLYGTEIEVERDADNAEMCLKLEKEMEKLEEKMVTAKNAKERKKKVD